MINKKTIEFFSKKNKKIHNIAKNNNKITEIKSVFPFDLFPNLISLDTQKIDIIYYRFPFFRKVFTLFYEDVRTVKIVEGIFFASIHFELKGYEQNPEPIRLLKKHEANKIRQLILGICVVKKEEVEIKQGKKNRKILRKIGKVK